MRYTRYTQRRYTRRKKNRSRYNSNNDGIFRQFYA